MPNITPYQQAYFTPPGQYCWRWAEDGNIIEWIDGSTVCFRVELVQLIQNLPSLPAFSTLVHLLAACKGLLTRERLTAVAQRLQAIHPTTQEALLQTMEALHQEVAAFNTWLPTIPDKYRQSGDRITLLATLLQQVEQPVPIRPVREAALLINSDQINWAHLAISSSAITIEAHLQYLQLLGKLSKIFPNQSALLVQVRTGLQQLPQPTVELPAAEPTHNLNDLLQDAQTAGLAAMAKKILVALPIPLHHHGARQQPLGGIADIANRGNYDQLLLSELAYEDAVFTARLVNNEALYYRKEQPPQQPQQQRVILVDATLKMWGAARVYALSAALAVAQPNKYASLQSAHVLKGNSQVPVNLLNKHGILQALEILDPALHCGAALEQYMQELPPNNNSEVYFITTEKLLHHPSFYPYWSRVRQQVKFVITVSGGGQIQLWQYKQGNSKLAGQAQLDIGTLVKPVGLPIRQVPVGKSTLPAFLQQSVCPLYMPVTSVKRADGRMFLSNNQQVFLYISNKQQLLVNRNIKKGPDELLYKIENGVYAFHQQTDTLFKIAVLNRQADGLFKLYTIDISNGLVKHLNLKDQFHDVVEAYFNGNTMYISTSHASFEYNHQLDQVTARKEWLALRTEINDAKQLQKQQQEIIYRTSFGSLPSDAIFFRLYRIGVNEAAQLVVGNQALILNTYHQDCRFQSVSSATALSKKAVRLSKEDQAASDLPPYIVTWVWKDGSRAMADERGFLHLKSSNAVIPEISLVLVMNQPVAFWAADGSGAGALRLLKEELYTVISVEAFYQRYLQPFIDHLI